MCMFCRPLFVLLSFFYWLSPSFKSVETTESENHVPHCVKLKSIWEILILIPQWHIRHVKRFECMSFKGEELKCFVDRCLSFCPFSIDYCVVCSSIYIFWLPLWYLQTLFKQHQSIKKPIILCLLVFQISHLLNYNAVRGKDPVPRAPLKNRGWIQVLRKGKQFLLH
jgi:hypothetical protein